MVTIAMNSVTSTVEFQIDAIELRAIAWVDVNLTGKELNAIQVNLIDSFFFQLNLFIFTYLHFQVFFVITLISDWLCKVSFNAFYQWLF